MAFEANHGFCDFRDFLTIVRSRCLVDIGCGVLHWLMSVSIVRSLGKHAGFSLELYQTNIAKSVCLSVCYISFYTALVILCLYISIFYVF